MNGGLGFTDPVGLAVEPGGSDQTIEAVGPVELESQNSYRNPTVGRVEADSLRASPPVTLVDPDFDPGDPSPISSEYVDYRY